MISPKEVINELLVDVFNHILSIENDVLKQRGVKLSMTEVHVLEAIRNVAPATMGNVAQKLRVTMGTLTTSINVLVRKKFVVRARDEKDKRKVNLTLTNSALDVLKIHDSFHDEMIESIFIDLELDKDEVLLKSLDNIRNYFKKLY
jgi:DNA-binding MarR family transcriptional regulator